MVTLLIGWGSQSPGATDKGQHRDKSRAMLVGDSRFLGGYLKGHLVGGTPNAMVEGMLSVWGKSSKVGPGLHDPTERGGCSERLCMRHRDCVGSPAPPLPQQVL